MKPNTIEIDEKGIFCYETPEKPKCGFNKIRNRNIVDRYNKKLEQAKRDRVYFKPERYHLSRLRMIATHISNDTDNPNYSFYHEYCKGIELVKGSPTPIPDGYEVKIKCQHKGIHNSTCIYHAILVPKEKSSIVNAVVQGQAAEQRKNKNQPFDFFCGDETNGDYRCEKQCKLCNGESLDRIKAARTILVPNQEDNLGYFKQLTFKQLVQHGIDNGANIVNGMPWSWKINGKAVTHERDDLYLIECINGTKRFEPGDQIRATKEGLLYIPYSDTSDAHAPGGCPM